MTAFKEVAKDQFDNYINEYGGNTYKSVNKTFEPPMLAVMDDNIGVWPKNVIAYAVLTEGEDYYDNEPTKYFIKAD